MGGMSRQSVMGQRQGNSPSAIGFNLRKVVVREVHPDKNICLAYDTQTNEEFPVGLDKRGSSSVWPQPGDGWIIDRSMGHWALLSKITSTQPPAITGNRNTMESGLTGLVGTLAGLGIVQDLTVATGPEIGVWQTPTMANGWIGAHKVDTTHNSGIRYQLSSANRLEFSGWLNSGTSINYTVMFTLPTDYIPHWDHTINGYRQDNNSSTASGSMVGVKVLGAVEGASAGQVQIITGSASNISGINLEILGSIPMD